METTFTETEVRKMLERLQTEATVRNNIAHQRYSKETISYNKGVAEGEMRGYGNMRFSVETEMIRLTTHSNVA